MCSLQLNESFTLLSKRRRQAQNYFGRNLSHINKSSSMKHRRIAMQSKLQEVNKNVEKGTCVVVGGGPAGLGTAIMLAQKGWQNIIVLEKLSEHQITDDTKSFQYQLQGRSQQFLESINVNKDIKKMGIFQFETTGISTAKVDGEIQYLSPTKDSARTYPFYYCVRSSILEVLNAKIQNQYQDIIQINFDARCLDMQKDVYGIKLNYQIQGQDSKEIRPQLIVGCDGYNSVIRQKLQEISENKNFYLNQTILPSSGRRYKILQVSKSFYFYKNSQSKVKNDSLMAYFIDGTSTDEKHKIQVFSLPSSKPLLQQNIRQISISTKQKDHVLWTQDTAEKVFKYLEKEFPQLNIREMLSEKQAEYFAKSKGGIHPIGGYCNNATYICDNYNSIPPTNPTPQEDTPPLQENNNIPTYAHQGVVLIGDSLHHFPPNFGLGANCAFEDIFILSEQLKKHNGDFVQALQKYDQLRVVDSKALIELQNYRNQTTFFSIFKTFLQKNVAIICPPRDNRYIHDESLRFSEVQARILLSDVIYSTYLAVVVLLVMFILKQGYDLLFY